MKKVGYACLSLLPAVLAIGIQFALVFVGMFIYIFYEMFQGQAAGGAINQEELMAGFYSGSIVIAITLAAHACYVIIFGIWYKLQFVKKTPSKLKEVATVKNIVCIVITGLLLQIAISCILSLVAPLLGDVFQQYEALMESMDLGNNWMSIVAVCILAPIGEEFIFRGVTLKLCGKYTNLFWANVIQAALFGIYHMNLIQGVYAFFLGLILGAICIRFKSVYPSILLHAAVNISGSFLEYILPESFGNTYASLIISTIVSVLGISGLLYWVLRKDKQIEEQAA